MHPATKPDITGQRFGIMTVIGRGVVKPRKKGGGVRTWRLRCDCGREVDLQRSSFERQGRCQKSCGCLKNLGYQGNRFIKDVTGVRFDDLTPLSIVPGKKSHKSPVWLCQCSCGKTRERSYKNLKDALRQGYRLNCGDPIHQPRKQYPPTPNPYPKEASDIVQKYLNLTGLSNPFVNKHDPEIRDQKFDELLRAAWILTYRKQQGEIFDEQHERCFIKKSLRHSAIAVFRKRKKESAKIRESKLIGGQMTDSTLRIEAIIETLPDIKLPTNTTPRKRLKFSRK